MQKPRRHRSRLLPKHRNRRRSHTRARSKKLESSTQGQEDNSPRRREDPSCRASVAEAKEEKEYDLRELPLAESRLKRLQAEERVLTSCPAALPGAQISSLMHQWNQFQAERRLIRADVDTTACCPRGGDASEEIPPRGFRARFAVEELVEWMEVVVNRK